MTVISSSGRFPLVKRIRFPDLEAANALRWVAPTAEYDSESAMSEVQCLKICTRVFWLLALPHVYP